MKSKSEKYKDIWLAFVQIKTEDGRGFNELIDTDDIIDENRQEKTPDLIGAWANIFIKALAIDNVLEIIPKGLKELGFTVERIDKVENIKYLIENNELKEEFKKDADWLLKSKYIFKISGRIFPYTSIPTEK